MNFGKIRHGRPLSPATALKFLMPAETGMPSMSAFSLILLFGVLLSGCATNRLSLHIDRKEAIINRGNFPTPMVELGKSAEAKYLGEYTVTRAEDGEALTFPHHCYSIKIDDGVYYLSIPRHGHICLIENNCPDLKQPHEPQEDLTIKFVDGGGSSTSDYQKNFSLTDDGKYNVVVRQNEKAKLHGHSFRRVHRHFWNGHHYNAIGTVVDVRVPSFYVSEGYLMLFKDGEIHEYDLALNIHGSTSSRVCNQSKRGFYLLTVPFDIVLFPWAIYDSLEMIDH